MIDIDRINEAHGTKITYKPMTEEELLQKLNLKAGWYQDIKGSLFQYDGLIWDKVPDCEVKNLEYLG